VQSLSKLKSVHITGTITGEGQDFGLDVQLASGVGATGAVTVGGGSLKVILLPTAIYVLADKQAVDAFAALAGSGSSGSAQFAQFEGKWLKIADLTKVAAGGPLDKIGNYDDFSKLTDAFKTTTGTVTMADKKTIAGQSAQGVKITDGSAQGAIVYLQASGGHLPLEIVPTGAGAGVTGKIDFVDYDKPVSITAPAGAVDLSGMLNSLLAGGLVPSPTS
jgi:hypothetical protein